MKQNQNVLFIIFPVTSHYNAVIPFARQQQRNGHVVFTGTDAYQSYLEANSFGFIALNYYRKIELKDWSICFWLFVNALLNRRSLHKRYRELLQAAFEVRRIVARLAPSEVFIDAHLSYYCLFIPGHCKVTILNTKLSTAKAAGIPPLNQSKIVNGGLPGRALTELLWGRHYCLQLLEYLKNKWVFLGADEIYLLKQYAARRKIAFRDFFESRRKNSFYLEINSARTGIASIIFAPEAFEYPWQKPRYSTYLDLDPACLMRTQALPGELREFLNVFREKQRGGKPLKLIYCAVGSMSKQHQAKVVPFLRRVINCVRSADEYYLVLSTGGPPVGLVDDRRHERIFLCPVAPQLFVLRHCDLMITHGGMNSIRECIWNKRMMLVYPVDNRFDQPGNSARVVYHRLGLRGKLEKDSEKTILKKIRACLAMGTGTTGGESGQSDRCCTPEYALP